MTKPLCARAIAIETLLEYWIGELDPEQEARLDEHLLGCGPCSADLQALVDLGGEVRAAVRGGEVRVILNDAFVQRLATHGMRLREYRVPHNGSVHCTVAPEDDLLITRLVAPLAGIDRLDIETLGGDDSTSERVRDVPFDAAAGEVVFTPHTERVRTLPAMTVRFRLLAVAPSGERVVGEYTLHHTPWRASD